MEGGGEGELQRRPGERGDPQRQRTLALVSRQTRENELGAQPDPGEQSLTGANTATQDVIILIFLVKGGYF